MPLPEDPTGSMAALIQQQIATMNGTAAPGFPRPFDADPMMQNVFNQYLASMQPQVPQVAPVNPSQAMQLQYMMAYKAASQQLQQMFMCPTAAAYAPTWNVNDIPF